MFNDKKKRNFRQAVFLSILCVLSSGITAEAASPKGDIKEGNRYYQKGEYAVAREKYSDALEKAPESDIVNFNLGTAYYKEEDYEKALDHLQKVLLSEDGELKKNAHYNLGNALYRLGITHEQDDINLAISSLEQSLKQYESVLSSDKDDGDAKHNHEFVQKELKRLKELQKQQQEQQKQCDLPKDEKDQQQQGQQSQQQQENQDQGQQSQDEQQKQQQGQQGESEQEEQGQSGQEEQQSQGQEEKQDQGRGQGAKEDYNKPQASGEQTQNTQALTQKEAQMLLENYQREEEPQGLLNFYPKTGHSRPIEKDW